MNFKYFLNEEGKTAVQPKTTKELKQIIKDYCKENGWDSDLNFIDTSKISSMNRLFYQSFSDNDISRFNGDISKWDVSNVRDMQWMFHDSSFRGDISKWDVSNVENMSKMFYHSSFNGDISKWNVSKVTDMSSMFANSYFFNGNISKWNVSKVKDMSGMFANSKFAGDISDWDVRHVKYAEDMFDNCPLEDKPEFQPEF